MFPGITSLYSDLIHRSPSSELGRFTRGESIRLIKPSLSRSIPTSLTAPRMGHPSPVVGFSATADGALHNRHQRILLVSPQRHMESN